MRRLIRLSSAIALAGSLLAIPGCVGDQESIIILRAIPLGGDDGTDCTADPDGDVSLAGGVVDVSFTTGYKAAFALLNNLQETGVNGTNQGTEASEMKLTEAIVEISFPGNSTIGGAVEAQEPTLVRYSAPLATNSWNGGDTIAPFVDIPPATLAAVGTQMEAQGITDLQMVMSVQFRAERSSNSGIGKSGVVESRSFEFPIDVCIGCLRACVPTPLTTTDANDEEVTDELCSAASCQADAVWVGGACRNAQDRAVFPPCCAGETDSSAQSLYCQ